MNRAKKNHTRHYPTGWSLGAKPNHSVHASRSNWNVKPRSRVQRYARPVHVNGVLLGENITARFLSLFLPHCLGWVYIYIFCFYRSQKNHGVLRGREDISTPLLYTHPPSPLHSSTNRIVFFSLLVKNRWSTSQIVNLYNYMHAKKTPSRFCVWLQHRYRVDTYLAFRKFKISICK